MTAAGHQLSRFPPGARRAPAPVVVLLSQQLATLGAGLDLAALQDWLWTTLPPVESRVAPRPIAQLGELARLATASGADRLVLGLAPGEYIAGEIQAQARRAGLDPLAVEAVNLGAQAALLCARPAATERAKLLLSAAVAKTRAFPGSRPEHLKVSLSVAVSRRALFTLAVDEYKAVPSVIAERCAADRGCRRCVDVCPEGALQLTNQRIELDKASCASCGLCLSVCPAEAFTFPGHSLAELDAQVTALLDPAHGDLAPRGILFVCRQSAARLDASVEQGFRYPAGWLPVVVSCAGTLSPALFMRCLALGAAAVGVAACGDLCAFGQDAIVAERVDFCQRLLERLGAARERVKLCPVGSDIVSSWALPAATGEPPACHLADMSASDPRAAAEAFLQLAQTHAAPVELTLTHAQSPFGVVEFDPLACTGCEACAAACPTGALVAEREGDATSISFDAAQCPACGLCVPRCPEAERGALRLHQAVDLRRLAAGRAVVYRDRASRCVVCGAPIAPAGMIARLAEMLGEQYAALAPSITRYCSDCRGGPAVK